MQTSLRTLPAFSPAAIDVTIDPAAGNANASTAQTIARMSQLIQKAQSAPKVLQSARAAIAELPMGADRRQICAAVFNWIRRHVRFVQDEELLAAELGHPDAAELLIAPWVLVAMDDPRGDCDDFSMLCASMLEVLSVPCQLVTIAADPQDPSRWSHVYVYARLENGGYLSMDTSHGSEPGWEAPRRFKIRTWPIEAGSPVANARGSRLNGLPAGYELERSVLNGPSQRRRRRRRPASLGSLGDDGVDWGSIITAGMNDATAILKPILTPQVTMTSGPYGTTYSGPPGSVVPGGLNTVGAGLGISSSTLLLMGGALLLVMLMGRR